MWPREIKAARREKREQSLGGWDWSMDQRILVLGLKGLRCMGSFSESHCSGLVWFFRAAMPHLWDETLFSVPCFHISLWLKGALEIGGGGATLYLCPTGHFGPKELAIWMEKKSHTALCSCMFLLEMGHFNGPSLILTYQHDSSVLSFTLTFARKSRKDNWTKPVSSLLLLWIFE